MQGHEMFGSRGFCNCVTKTVAAVFSLLLIKTLLSISLPITDSQTSMQCSSPTATTKVAFMKTHKTGSSSVQNILFRLAYKLEWNLVLPSVGHTLGDMVRHLDREEVSKVPWRKMMDKQGYNIMALHTKWDQEQAKLIMGEGTIYITILRDPVQQFISAFYFYKLDKFFKTDLRRFIKDCIEGGQHIPWVDNRKGRNQQLLDLGMDPLQTEDREQVVKKIEEVENNFHLVMILERLDESLVLLSDILCLTLGELTSLKVNEMTIEKENITVHQMNVLRKWLWAEYLLYDKFVENLNKKIVKYGTDRMEEKKMELKTLNQQLQKKCVKGPGADKFDQLHKPHNPDVKGFHVSEQANCSGYGWPELQFVEIFRKEHQERWGKWEMGLPFNRRENMFDKI